MSNCTVNLDWKVVAASGASAVLLFSVKKMDASAIKEVLLKFAENSNLSYANAFNGIR